MHYLPSPLVSIWNPFMFMGRRSAGWLASTLLAIIMTCCVVMRGSFPGASLRSGPTHRLSRCVVAALMVMMLPRSGRAPRGRLRAPAGLLRPPVRRLERLLPRVSVRSKPAAGSVPAPPSVWTSTPSAASSTVGANGRRVRAHTLPSCSGGRMGDRTPRLHRSLLRSFGRCPRMPLLRSATIITNSGTRTNLATPSARCARLCR